MFALRLSQHGGPAHGNPATSYLAHPAPRGRRDRGGRHRPAAPADRPAGVQDAGHVDRPGNHNPDPGQPAHHLRRRKRGLGLAGCLPGRPGDLGAAVAQPHPHDPGDAHRRKEPRLSTVGVGYPGGKDQAAIAYAACDGKPDLACQVAIKQGAPGDDLNVAVTAAIPHAIRNAWLIHAPGGAEQIDAIRKNWSWEQFQPLLQKEGTAWRSSCLSVSKP